MLDGTLARRRVSITTAKRHQLRAHRRMADSCQVRRVGAALNHMIDSLDEDITELKRAGEALLDLNEQLKREQETT